MIKLWKTIMSFIIIKKKLTDPSYTNSFLIYCKPKKTCHLIIRNRRPTKTPLQVHIIKKHIVKLKTVAFKHMWDDLGNHVETAYMSPVNWSHQEPLHVTHQIPLACQHPENTTTIIYQEKDPRSIYF